MLLLFQGSSIEFEDIWNINERDSGNEMKRFSIDLSKGFLVEGELGRSVEASTTTSITRMRIKPNKQNHDYHLDSSVISISSPTKEEEEFSTNYTFDDGGGSFWIIFHQETIDPPEHRHEEALIWMSTLSSIAFSKWWSYKAQLEKEFSQKSQGAKTTSSSPILIHYHLWQACRVALYELMYHVSDNHSDHVTSHESCFLSKVGSLHPAVKRRHDFALRAWRYVKTCLNKINEESTTHWVLPLSINIRSSY